MEKLGPPEKRGDFFSWSNWQEMKVEPVSKEANKGSWLTLYYDPEYPPETLNKLHVREKMPFEVMLKLDDIQPDDLQQIFQQAETPNRTKAFQTGFRLKNHVIVPEQQGLARLFQESLRQLMAKASLSFFWHGWASDARVWHTQLEKEKLLKENIEQRSTPGKPIINIIPDGLGIKGGCIAQEVNGNPAFTPEMYGRQMAEFVNLFGWDKVRDVFGHSMGGIGTLWLALEIINNPLFRNSDGQIPNLRLWLLSPAYPKEANTFIQLYLDICLKFLRSTPVQLRPLGKPIAILINQHLLPLSLEELHKVQSDVVVKNPETVIETMHGLALQDYFTPEQWQQIISKFPVSIYTTGDDRLVNENISNTAFSCLTEEVRKAWPQTPIIEPLILSGKGDHYLAAMATGRDEIERTGRKKKVIIAGPRLLPVLYDKISSEYLPEFINDLYEILRQMHSEKRQIRKQRAESRIQFLFEKIRTKTVLADETEQVIRFLLVNAFEYCNLLWV